MRKCWICKVEYPLTTEYFYKDNVDSKGFQKGCKKCQIERNIKYREDHKEYFKEKGKAHYKKEDNHDRYMKNRDKYLERKKIFEQSLRGKMYNLLESARGRAKKHSLEIDIDLDFLLELYNSNNGKCKLTNIEFELIRDSKYKNRFSPFSPSLDKIDSTKGYLKTNVRLVCTMVNLSLNTFGDECFDRMCKSYMEHKYQH